MNKNLCSVILGAGLGKRMKSELPKVLHEICGMSLVEHVLLNVEQAGVEDIALIVGHKSELVKEKTKNRYNYFLQKEQLGTAHALMQARAFLEEHIASRVIVLCADAPFIMEDTLREFIAFAKDNDLDAGVLTAVLQDARAYGRIIRQNGGLDKIVEAKDATPAQLAVREVNSGAYIFKAESLLAVLDKITDDNAQHEYYLTDAIGLLIKQDKKVDAFIAKDPNVMLGINTRKELCEARAIMQRMINEKHLENGVNIIDEQNTYIDRQVKIACTATIFPNTMVLGNTSIAAGATIKGGRIEDSNIGENCVIDMSVIEQSTIEQNAKIGPFAHLRPNSLVQDGAKIGNFVETKNTVVGKGSKLSHLTYAGDGKIGSNVNIGCGVVFVNYDGATKYQTTIEDNCFIGCNANLIAPVHIGKDAFVAAGSTITEDVPAGSLAIARSRQTIKEDWNKK